MTEPVTPPLPCCGAELSTMIIPAEPFHSYWFKSADRKTFRPELRRFGSKL